MVAMMIPFIGSGSGHAVRLLGGESGNFAQTVNDFTAAGTEEIIFPSSVAGITALFDVERKEWSITGQQPTGVLSHGRRHSSPGAVIYGETRRRQR